MLTSLAFIFLFGLLLGAVCHVLKLPGLIGMLVTGIVLGPHVLNLLDASMLAISTDLRQLALIIILTRAGLSLDLEDLRQIGRPAVLMSFVPACFEMAGTITLATWLFGLPLQSAAILAAVVASASPAVIVPRMIHLMSEGFGTERRIPQLILAGASVDDVFNLVVFTSLVGVADGAGISAVPFAGIALSIALGIGVGALVGCLLGFCFRKIHMRDSVKVLIILSAACLLVAFEQCVKGVAPFSALLAVMAVGVALLKNTPAAAKRIAIKFSKLWVGAEILLFVLVGASVNIGYAAGAGVRTIALLVAALLVRALGTWLCLLKTPLNRKERLFCALAGIPKATVQAAIGGIPLAMGLPHGELILAVAVLSILFTAPLGALVTDATYKRLLTRSV